MTDLVRRRLQREEIGLLWTIDRRELVERIYELRSGRLVLRRSSTSAGTTAGWDWGLSCSMRLMRRRQDWGPRVSTYPRRRPRTPSTSIGVGAAASPRTLIPNFSHWNPRTSTSSAGASLGLTPEDRHIAWSHRPERGVHSGDRKKRRSRWPTFLKIVDSRNGGPPLRSLSWTGEPVEPAALGRPLGHGGRPPNPPVRSAPPELFQ